MKLSNTNRLGSLTFGAHCVYRRQKRNKNTNKTNDQRNVTLKNKNAAHAKNFDYITRGIIKTVCI